MAQRNPSTIPSKPPEPRASEVETARRVSEIEHDMLAGATTRAMELKFSEAWGVSTRQVRTYLAKARAAVLDDHAERTKAPLATMRATYRSRLEFLHEKAVAAERFDWALNGLKEIGKFDGIDTGDSGTVVNVILPDWAAPTPDAE